MRLAVGLFLCIAFTSLVAAQNPPTSDPQALSFASQSIAALTGGAALSDVTLTGTVSWTVGSNTETGTGTLLAKGTAASRVDLALSAGKRSEIRNFTNGSSQGAWIDSSGTSNSYATQNCWTDASWFFPALSSLAAFATDPTVILIYRGTEQRNGVSVQHIQSFRYISSPTAAATVSSQRMNAFTQKMSTVDYYLDSASLLPIGISFDAHPDDDANTNIAVEIDFSNYQKVDGVLVPFHIEKFWQGNLLLDLVVTNAVFNSGLRDSLFALN